jgi:hypothetical protein
MNNLTKMLSYRRLVVRRPGGLEYNYPTQASGIGCLPLAGRT